MEPIPTKAKSVVFFTCSCGGWNQFKQQQKAWYSLVVHVEDGTRSSDSKSEVFLYIFMWRMEPVPTTLK
jgi:hypothetical protein